MPVGGVIVVQFERSRAGLVCDRVGHRGTAVYNDGTGASPRPDVNVAILYQRVLASSHHSNGMMTSGKAFRSEYGAPPCCWKCRSSGCPNGRHSWSFSK